MTDAEIRKMAKQVRDTVIAGKIKFQMGSDIDGFETVDIIQAALRRVRQETIEELGAMNNEAAKEAIAFVKKEAALGNIALGNEIAVMGNVLFDKKIRALRGKGET